jgi:acyl-homoserine lactone acylase PvdQ
LTIKGNGYKSQHFNNTVYADKEGNIAYWHGNFVPIRDPKLVKSCRRHNNRNTMERTARGFRNCAFYNPENGWLQNCNSTPLLLQEQSKPENYPPYMAPDGENFRGLNAADC